MQVVWFPEIVPSEEIAVLGESTVVGDYYFRYHLDGVEGDSLRIRVTGAARIGDAKTSSSDGSLDGTLYLPPSDGRIFHFVPPPLKGLGWFEIESDPTNSGVYTVSLVKRSAP